MYERVIIPLMLVYAVLGFISGFLLFIAVIEYGAGVLGAVGWLIVSAAAVAWLICVVLVIRHDNEHGQWGSGGTAGGP